MSSGASQPPAGVDTASPEARAKPTRRERRKQGPLEVRAGSVLFRVDPSSKGALTFSSESFTFQTAPAHFDLLTKVPWQDPSTAAKLSFKCVFSPSGVEKELKRLANAKEGVRMPSLGDPVVPGDRPHPIIRSVNPGDDLAVAQP